MKIILITLKKILFWSYERGSWQYDVMCVLILAFIFLSPNRFFQSRGESMPHIVRGAETAGFEPKGMNPMGLIHQVDSNAVNISRIERPEAESRSNNYIALVRTPVRAVQFIEKHHETK